MTGQLVSIFGGTGFVGRTVVRQLTAAGTRVRVVSRHPEAFAGHEHADRIETSRGDIRNPDDVARALEGATGAVNAVSLYAEGAGLTFDDIHVKGAGELAERAAAAGVERVAHVSGLGVDEGSTSAYISARARGEDRVREAFPQTTILRPSVIFGPDDAFLSTLRSVTLAPIVPLFGEGRTRLQPVHVEDVASAVVRALEDEAAPGRIYELGGPDVLTYREIVEMVLRHLGRRRLLLPVPFGAWHALAGAASLLPAPPLTRDQVALLEHDNVVGEGAATLADLGIEPKTLGATLQTCLPL